MRAAGARGEGWDSENSAYCDDASWLLRLQDIEVCFELSSFPFEIPGIDYQADLPISADLLKILY